jgi:GT2 family glycosyltransferase
MGEKESAMKSNTNTGSPMVSIVILYYKRPEVIEDTLKSALRQNYPNREIILVDNNSEDNLRNVVERLSPEIRLIELSENRGACGGRNAGIRIAKGDIIVFIDDDVTFDSTRELSKIVDTFQQKPDYHVLALQIWDPRTDRPRIREWCHTRPIHKYVDQEFETDWYCEGMSAFRREVLDQCGLYYEPLFYGPEGHDMVLRLMDHGFRVLYAPHIRVNHWASESGRTHYRQFYYFTRAFIWMAYKDYPLWAGLQFAIPKELMMGYFAWRTSVYSPVLRGVWDGLKGLKAIRADRTPVSRATLRRIAEHDRWRPGILARLARHRMEPQI